MPEHASNSAIPVWQRAPIIPNTEDPVSSQPTSAPPESKPEQPLEPIAAPNPTTSPTAEALEAERVAAPPSTPPTLNAAEFEGNTARNLQTTPPPVHQSSSASQQTVSSSPPIITYPEFLARAHQPPPLITPTRVFNALYLAGGAAALIYGANKYLVQPMVEAQTASRHDFLGHSQSKVDKLNERLEKIVGRNPSSVDQERNRNAGGSTENDRGDDAESLASDPTELWHRDMGTQTDASDHPSTSSANFASASSAAIAGPIGSLDASLATLTSLATQLDSLLPQSQPADPSTSASELRRTAFNALRHYLDTLQYASAGAINVWSTTDDVGKTTAAMKDKEEDVVEELKKEIRGVKGLLLSARRFPAFAAVGRAA